jgi:hypothetical protein
MVCQLVEALGRLRRFPVLASVLLRRLVPLIVCHAAVLLLTPEGDLEAATVVQM